MRAPIHETKADSLYVRQLPLGPMQNFVYLVGAPGSVETAVIDPAWDVPSILAAAEEDGRRITAAFLSHHHFDHLNGVQALLEAREVPVYAQQREVEFADILKDFGDAVKPVAPGQVVAVGPLELTCIHTPGHTPGSQCVLCGGALLSGDTVFVNACGRCDLPGGDARQMFDSLHRVLGALPAQTRLLPGHDYGDVAVSTLARERQNNPYLLARDLPEFLGRRLG